MIRIDAVIARCPGLGEPEIADWVARGWVHVEGASRAEWRFSEGEVARLRLIRELRVDLEVEEESLPLVLSLLDQVYGLRRALRSVMEVLNDAPEDLRRRVIAAVRQQTP